MDRAEKAVGLRAGGNNCCQAVMVSFADVLDVDTETLRRFGAGFGGGMACMESTCGALCGAQMILGLRLSDGKPIRNQARSLVAKFREEVGATICREIRGVETGKALCPCEDCIRTAVRLAEEISRNPEM